MQPTLLVTMQRNNTGEVSASMEPLDHGYLVTTRVLHSNDGLRSNTSQYIYIYIHGPPLWSSGRVPGCKPRDPEFDSRRYQIFCVAVGLERGPLSLVRINE
jgi:hypothetical protein